MVEDEEEKKKEKKIEEEMTQEEANKIEQKEEKKVEKKSDEQLDAIILDKIHSTSEARQLDMIEYLEKDHKPYILTKIYKENGKSKIYIETRNAFNFKDTLKEFRFHFNHIKRTWELDTPLTIEEFKKIMRTIAERVDAIIVADNSYKKIKTVFGGVEKVMMPEPTQEKIKEVKAPEVAPPPETNTLNPEKDIAEKEIPIAEVNESELDLSRTPPKEEIATAEKEETKQPQQYVISYQILKDRVKEMERTVQKAINDFVKLMDGELVYIHYNRNAVNIIVDKAYTKRDALKKLGYKYNGIAKTWEKTVGVKDYDAEINKLYELGVMVVMPIGLNPEKAKEEMQKATKNFYHKYRQHGSKYKGGKTPQKTQKEMGVGL